MGTRLNPVGDISTAFSSLGVLMYRESTLRAPRFVGPETNATGRVSSKRAF